MNTDRRKHAANRFEKVFLNWWIANSISGKTMENLRKRINLKLVINDKDYKNM